MSASEKSDLENAQSPEPAGVEGSAFLLDDDSASHASSPGVSVYAYGHGLGKYPFCEQARAVNTSADGCSLLLSVRVSVGQNLALTNGSKSKDQECQVVSVDRYDTKTFQVAVVFPSPNADFWEVPPAASSNGSGTPGAAAVKAPGADLGIRGRRSTRVVQSLPLTVTGIDALGRRFEERTSTLMLNCHGCRYQSRHYALKGMWVTIEVPASESRSAVRRVRGQVLWVRPPRTARELIELGVEFETAGNLWSIADPPPDWFPFPDLPPAQPAHKTGEAQDIQVHEGNAKQAGSGVLGIEEELTSALSAVALAAQQQLERRAADLLEHQSQEINRRLDSAVASWTQRLQPALQAAGQETVARLGVQLEQELGSRLDRVREVLARLDSRTQAADEALRKGQEASANLSAQGQIADLAPARLQILGQEFEQSAAAIAAKLLADMETKATESSRKSLEAVLQAALAYEKVVQTQISTHIEAVLDRVQTTFGNLEQDFEKSALVLTGKLLADIEVKVADTALSSFNQKAREMSEQTEATLERVQSAIASLEDGFEKSAGTVTSKLLADLEAKAAETTHSTFEALFKTAEWYEKKVHTQMQATIQKGSEEAISSLREQGREISGAFAAEINQQGRLLADRAHALERQFADHLSHFANERVGEYKQRLDDEANGSLRSAADKFAELCGQNIEVVSRSSEERLREMCNQVFAEAGENLRQRLLVLAAFPAVKPAGEQ
jgi:hypothetical protein